MPFPDSGSYAAIGYSEASGIPFEMGMIRNHYVGRTFIQPTQSMRDFGVRVKLNPVRDLLKDKDIVIIEDSIIRGTTVRTRVKSLRALGVRKVHLRVSGPPHRFPCHYGIDFSTRGELIAATMRSRRFAISSRPTVSPISAWRGSYPPPAFLIRSKPSAKPVSTAAILWRLTKRGSPKTVWKPFRRFYLRYHFPLASWSQVPLGARWPIWAARCWPTMVTLASCFLAMLW